MNDHRTLCFKKSGSIGFIDINHFIRCKAPRIELSQELHDICSEIISDESILVLIVSGTDEKAFSLIFAKDLSFGNSHISDMGLPLIAEPIANLAIPVIAAINGDAIGQGLELALGCDFRIVTETARFGFPQIAAGIMPWDGGTQRLPRLIGRGKALELLLTADTIDAIEAYRIGLVNRVVPSKELMSVTLNFAQSLVAKGPLALKYAKEAVLKGMDLTLDQGLRLEADLYCLLQTTTDRTEGIKAFREKRPPEFKGA